MPLRSN